MGDLDEIILRIKPKENTILMESVSKNCRSTKRISYDTLLKSIAESMEKTYISSGLLPCNCLSYASNGKGTNAVTLLHPERYADITYAGKTYEHFPLPRLVSRFEFKLGQSVTACYMGVVKDERITPETPMYYYPFSNVSQVDGRVCLGNNTMPICKSPHTLSSLPYYILSMPNNDDHFRSSYNQLDMGMRDLLETLRDQPPDFYYTDVLKPNGKTLSDFIGGASQ